ncbi:MAG: Gfo/Idh/MocA family oxidoreductase [Rhodospirillales bacterium]|nr:Gfo/Idh/MocA family oxidoreductase [Rhodospirillales bacterium]
MSDPSSTPLRVGIAGYGVVGKRRHHFIDAHPDMKLIAVCDRTFDGTGTLDGGATHYTTYTELLGKSLDVLFVCMTNDIAPDVTIAGLDRGLHVFCEKPPGRDVADIVRVCQKHAETPHLKLKYGFNHRYHDSVRDALAIVESGELGAVINLRGVYGKSKFVSFGENSDWRVTRAIAGGGILLDQGIHMVDLMRLFGGEFTDISSFISNDYWKHDVEDNAYALMRGKGVVAMLHSSATQWRHRFNLEVTLQRGSLILSGILSGTKSYGAETLTIARAAADDLGDPDEETREYTNDPSWADEIAEFATAVREDIPITNGSVEEALKTMQLVYAIYCADPDWRARWRLTDGVPELP